MTGYSADLAFIHHAGFGDIARAAAEEVIRLLRARNISDGLVVDLGCGSGIGARALTEAGYRVLGVDISRAMIRLARRNAPDAKFVAASLLRVKLPRCAAVTAIGEAINYAFDPVNSMQALARLFRRIYAALIPGGLFVFDFAEPGQGERTAYITGAGWAVIAHSGEDPRRHQLTRRIVSFRRDGSLYRRTDETHRVQLYGATDLVAELRRTGFRARVFRGYGKLQLRPGHAAIAAWKPAAQSNAPDRKVAPRAHA